MFTVVYYRVVSTKLTEEEHSKLLDVCNIIGCTSSVLIRDAVLKIINVEQKTTEQMINPKQTFVKEFSIKSQHTKIEPLSTELEKLLGMKKIN